MIHLHRLNAELPKETKENFHIQIEEVITLDLDEKISNFFMEMISTFYEVSKNNIDQFYPPEGSDVVLIEKNLTFSSFSEISRNFWKFLKNFQKFKKFIFLAF